MQKSSILFAEMIISVLPSLHFPCVPLTTQVQYESQVLIHFKPRGRKTPLHSPFRSCKENLPEVTRKTATHTRTRSKSSENELYHSRRVFPRRWGFFFYVSYLSLIIRDKWMRGATRGYTWEGLNELSLGGIPYKNLVSVTR